MNIQNIQKATHEINDKTQGVERRGHKPEIKKAAKEMEALFVYELLKVMRETTESMSSEQKGLGNETYMSLFDMEISKVMAEKGFGIQDPLVNSLERVTQDNGKTNDNIYKKK